MNDDSGKEFDRITDLGKARSDEYTERLLAFVQDMEASGPEPFIPLLADIALVRALIVHLVIQYGPVLILAVSSLQSPSFSGR